MDKLPLRLPPARRVRKGVPLPGGRRQRASEIRRRGRSAKRGAARGLCGGRGVAAASGAASAAAAAAGAVAGVHAALNGGPGGARHGGRPHGPGACGGGRWRSGPRDHRPRIGRLAGPAGAVDGREAAWAALLTSASVRQRRGIEWLSSGGRASVHTSVSTGGRGCSRRCCSGTRPWRSPSPGHCRRESRGAGAASPGSECLLRWLQARPEALVVHVCGSFHCEKRVGIAEMLSAYAPQPPSTLVVAMYPETECHAFRPQHEGAADFVILTDASLPRSYDHSPHEE